jgi:hypothetical protein
LENGFAPALEGHSREFGGDASLLVTKACIVVHEATSTEANVDDLSIWLGLFSTSFPAAFFA